MSKKSKKETIIKDFGEYNIPTCWDDVTLEKFVKLQNDIDETNEFTSLYSIISIMSDKPFSEVSDLPYDFVEQIMARLSFMRTMPEVEAKNEVEIDGEKYIINYQNKLVFGEYTNVQMLLQNDKYAYAEVLAVLCRKVNEEYSNQFIIDNFDERVKLFNSCPITKIMPLVLFFSTYWILSQKSSEIYSDLQKQTDQLAQSINNSAKNGGGKKLYTNWRTKISSMLKRSKK